MLIDRVILPRTPFNILLAIGILMSFLGLACTEPINEDIIVETIVFMANTLQTYAANPEEGMTMIDAYFMRHNDRLTKAIHQYQDKREVWSPKVRQTKDQEFLNRIQKPIVQLSEMFEKYPKLYQYLTGIIIPIIPIHNLKKKS